MNTYKASKGIGVYHILGSLLIYDIVIMFLLYMVNSYVIASLLKISLIVFTIYHIYYGLLCITMKYIVDEESVYIEGIYGLKRVVIPVNQIQAYTKISGKVNGIKLSGFGKGVFILGKAVVEKIGTTHMYVTSTKEIIYLKTEDIIYAISPENIADFKNEIEKKNIQQMNWEYKWCKDSHLVKDKKFIRLMIYTSVIILVLTLNPFIFYLFHKLPTKMPLNFDASFLPVEYGSGKQFAFSQMIYGVLNMAILVCMYYASYFYGKYDKKFGYRFIYTALIISVAFLLIQFRILYTFI